jgi:hypothetical protein
VEPVLPIDGVAVGPRDGCPADGMTVNVDEPIPGDAFMMLRMQFEFDAMQVDDQEV